jgi:hypothetical protein
MATPLPGWPDAELVMLDLLEATGAPTVTATDETLTPPVIQVARIGGSDDGITDRPRVEVECFGATRAQAWALAEQCRQLILAASAASVNGALIDRAVSETPAQQLPYANPDVRRVAAVYRLSLRRPR